MKRVDLQLEQDRKDKALPLLTYCHAGSGRTGVFIADRMIRDSIKEQLMKKPLSETTLNIPRIVFNMKLCREMIYKAPNQYQFLLGAAERYINELK